MLLTGPLGRIWDANPAACRALGRTVDDLRSAGIDALRVASDERWARLGKPGRRAAGVTEQLCVRRADGSSFPAEVSWAELAVDGQHLALLLFRDVSERYRLEQELRTLAADLAMQATIDDLTGLLNRRGFLDAAEKEVAKARRTGGPLCLLAADVDGLKQVNDQFGHAAGDQMLRDVATVLAGTLRAADLIARIGGDEFCVLLAGAHAVADTVSARLRIANALLRYAQAQGRPYSLSVSIGVAAADTSGPSELWELMDRADKQLYAAKRRRARRAHAAATR